MIIILIRAISWFARVLFLLLMGRAILSWFAQDPYSSLGKAYYYACKITEPIVAPCRKILTRFNTGMFDFSVLLAFFLIEIVERILIYILVLFI